jgi:hypothetical protein
MVIHIAMIRNLNNRETLVSFSGNNLSFLEILHRLIDRCILHEIFYIICHSTS